MGSSPRSYLLTSASIRIPVHTATKNGRNLPDIRSRSTFKIGAAQVISVAEIPVKSPILFVNRSALSGAPVFVPAAQLSNIVWKEPQWTLQYTMLILLHSGLSTTKTESISVKAAFKGSQENRNWSNDKCIKNMWLVILQLDVHTLTTWSVQQVAIGNRQRAIGQ